MVVVCEMHKHKADVSHNSASGHCDSEQWGDSCAGVRNREIQKLSLRLKRGMMKL
jgi:hypothetical protein